MLVSAGLFLDFFSNKNTRTPPSPTRGLCAGDAHCLAETRWAMQSILLHMWDPPRAWFLPRR